MQRENSNNYPDITVMYNHVIPIIIIRGRFAIADSTGYIVPVRVWNIERNAFRLLVILFFVSVHSYTSAPKRAGGVRCDHRSGEIENLPEKK